MIWVFGSLVIVIKTGIRWDILDFEYLSKNGFDYCVFKLKEGLS